MSRTRFDKAIKKQQRSNAMWGDLDKSWMRWVKCSVCGQRVCVNNYADRKVRLHKIKFDDLVICLNCQAHGRKEVIVALLRLARALADKACPTQCGKCARCRSRKIIENLPSPPKAFRRQDESDRVHREQASV